LDPEYGRRYRELHEHHWWWRARERVILDALQAVTPAGGFRHILDVGCGDGLMFGPLSRLGTVEGIEPDAALVSRTVTPQGRIHVRPFDESFQPGRRYGLVLMLDVLEHLDDAEGAARHAAGLLAAGGILLVTVPAFRWLWTAHDVLNQHRTRYTRGELLRLLSDARLDVEVCRYVFRWLVPAKLAVRAKELALRGAPRPPSMPPRPLNQLLYGLSRAEERLLRGLASPPGSSVLAIARG
jgi:SAM-dependent methyltransferase